MTGTVHPTAHPSGPVQRPERRRYIERSEDMDLGMKWVGGVVLTAIVVGTLASQIGHGPAAEARPEPVASASTVAPTATTIDDHTTEAPATTLSATRTEAPTTTIAKTTTTTIPRAKVIRWVDGDTVETTVGTVRLIGMDTPERGAPCSARATANAERLAPTGSTVNLIPVQGRDDTDRYDRLLRYVMRDRLDVGYRQIVHGFADARYDSGDYGSHPKRDEYRQADAENSNQTCEVTTTTTSTTPRRWHPLPRPSRRLQPCRRLRPLKRRQRTVTQATRTSAFRLRRPTWTVGTSTAPTSPLLGPTLMGLTAVARESAAKAELWVTTPQEAQGRPSYWPANSAATLERQFDSGGSPDGAYHSDEVSSFIVSPTSAHTLLGRGCLSPRSDPTWDPARMPRSGTRRHHASVRPTVVPIACVGPERSSGRTICAEQVPWAGIVPTLIDGWTPNYQALSVGWVGYPGTAIASGSFPPCRGRHRPMRWGEGSTGPKRFDLG